MTKDYLGQELKEGDKIIYIKRNINHFLEGKITKINNKMVEINGVTKQYFNKVIKKPLKDQIVKKLIHSLIDEE